MFTAAGPNGGRLIDDTGGVWTVSEDGMLGPAEERLARVSGHNAFWFAIANQAPEAQALRGVSSIGIDR